MTMPLIPEDLIDEIQARMDIAEFIGRYVPMKQVGRHFKANCPFHKERTPSFMVNTEKQIFHCFGCGVGGNIFSFLMQHDRLTFPEAVRQLADQAGLALPVQGGGGDGTQRALSSLVDKVARYFERLLDEPQPGRAGREYLAQRGVSDRTRRAFRLGLAPTGWSQLLSAARGIGMSVEQLEAAGLVIKGRSGHYDRFRNRVVFPISDLRGRVVGFGGRSLDGQEPKYLNSPETALYTKGRHLFGLVQAKEAILSVKTAIVVEGYFDCVVLSDAGIANVVSPLGTALTIDQARLLKRYAEQVILAFDPDAAGEQATLRGIDLLVELGLQVRVAQLPPGIDPDEHVRAEGPEQFRALLDRAQTLFEFLIRSAIRQYPPNAVEPRVRAAQVVLPTIAKVPDAMLRSEYVRLLADQLHLDAGAVLQELAKVQPRSTVTEPAALRSSGPARVPAPGSERLLTALVVDDPTILPVVLVQVPLAEMTDPALRRILGVISELQAAGEQATPAQVVSRLSAEGLGALVAELAELAQSVAEKPAALDDCVNRLAGRRRQRELTALREQIQLAQDAGREPDVHRLLAEYQQRLMTSSVGEAAEPTGRTTR